MHKQTPLARGQDRVPSVTEDSTGLCPRGHFQIESRGRQTGWWSAPGSFKPGTPDTPREWVPRDLWLPLGVNQDLLWMSPPLPGNQRPTISKHSAIHNLQEEVKWCRFSSHPKKSIIFFLLKDWKKNHITCFYEQAIREFFFSRNLSNQRDFFFQNDFLTIHLKKKIWFVGLSDSL